VIWVSGISIWSVFMDFAEIPSQPLSCCYNHQPSQLAFMRPPESSLAKQIAGVSD
jgi:hypothetical protein